MSSPFDFVAESDYPTSFADLRAFKKAVEDAIAVNDQRLLNYLAENFAVYDKGVIFIGS